MHASLLTLFHLADSALPVGGYAYSNGLEYAVKSGLIASVKELQLYLKDYTVQVLHYEMPYVKSAFEADDAQQLLQVSEHYNASLLNPLIKKAGLILGNNWLRLLRELNASLMAPEKIDQDFPLVFGFMAKQLNLSFSDCCQLYVFMAVRDQISALIRLGTVGPVKAHQIQNELLEHLNSTLQNKEIANYSQAYKSAYLLEMMQLSHNSLYTKLFQN